MDTEPPKRKSHKPLWFMAFGVHPRGSDTANAGVAEIVIGRRCGAISGDFSIQHGPAGRAEGGYFPFHDFQIEAFQSQEHPEQVGPFRVVTEPTGAFDGKVFPSTDSGFAYVMGWLYGYRAATNSSAASR